MEHNIGCWNKGNRGGNKICRYRSRRTKELTFTILIKSDFSFDKLQLPNLLFSHMNSFFGGATIHRHHFLLFHSVIFCTVHYFLKLISIFMFQLGLLDPKKSLIGCKKKILSAVQHLSF